MFDLISVGDCTIDHLFIVSQAHLDKMDHSKNLEICFSFGSKIPVEKYSQSVAGNNANVAVGVARFGLKTALYTNIGSDPDGEKIIKKLKEEKVDTSYIKINPKMDSNISAVIDFQGERTILVYHQPWEYTLPDLDRTKWIYLSSMSGSFSASSIINQLESYLERTGAKLGFNPGTYQLKLGIKKFPRLLSLIDLLLVNLEEAKLILELKEEKVEIKKLLRNLGGLGPQKIIITDGKNGSFGFDGEKYFKIGIFPAHLAEMTGAGDAYASGIISALIYGKDLDEAMRWGAANSASVIGQIGSQTGLLTYREMQIKLKENQKITAQMLS